ncbi:MAG: ornithine carbamoyltransferase [Oscillospiraceae bacterium]|nr:ornithine carbamoyltransferase [Oscillospiraceae bacterium]
MKHLLKLLDITPAEIETILNLGDQMKYNHKHGLPHKTLQGKTLGMIFTKSSTRTRVSFEAGMFHLGGHALFLSGNELQLGRGEPIEHTAQVLSRYVDGIMIRTYKHNDVEELAQHASVPVINGLTDVWHPCQVLADLMTIRERLHTLDKLKICFIGDGADNVCNSLIVGALKCNMEVAVASPKNYKPHPLVMDFVQDNSKFMLTESPKEAADGADVVVTDVWTSMGQEDEAALRRRAFADYQVNAKLMQYAKPNALVLHCLPAHCGEEIDQETFDAHASEIYDEAENRMHVQKAVMTLLMGEQ